MGSVLDVRSLRQQIYEYLQKEIQAGRLVPGSFINLNEISEHLGVSKTPLRDAIIQMECEGFVSILPRRGVLLKSLTLEDIKGILEILGALESAVLRSVFDKITPRRIKRMEQLNADMRRCIREKTFEEFDPQYYSLNIAFHDVFLELSSNAAMKPLLTTMKQRLYDFPRLAYMKDWEWANCDEHDRLIDHIRKGEKDEAALFWQETHWGFEAQKPYIIEFYAQGNKHIRLNTERNGEHQTFSK
jgi:DNA-binding GntR family transcriptional regulator